RLGDARFLLCVNASNRDKIVSWLFQKAPQGDVRLDDESDELAQIALQGPRSPGVLRAVVPRAADTLKPRQCVETDVCSVHGVVSRTGYTGEVGYELYVPSHKAVAVWEALMKAGGSAGIKPCGLGARDLLRLEVGYLLYGNDIDEQTTPLEAGAALAGDFTNGGLIGRAPPPQQKEKGPAEQPNAVDTLPNGTTVELEVIHHPGAAAVVPLKDERTVLLIRQYRHAVGGYIYEIPAGKLHPGEDPRVCAQRELEEEIGYKAGQLDHVVSAYTTPG